MITIIAAKVQHMIQMILMAEKVQNLPKRIQMTPITALMMTFQPAEKDLDLMVWVAKLLKMIMREMVESLPKTICLVEKVLKDQKVDLVVEKDQRIMIMIHQITTTMVEKAAMMISLEEKRQKMEMEVPVIFMEGKDQSLAQILPIVEDQEMTSMKMGQGMTQMTPTIVAKVQPMIQMIHIAEKVQSLAKMAPWVNMDPEMTSMMMMTMVH